MTFVNSLLNTDFVFQWLELQSDWNRRQQCIYRSVKPKTTV